MIRLNQWSALIENCAYCHTKAVHVAVETPFFLLLYFRCYIHEIINIWRCEESKERLMNLKLNLIPSFLYSHLCNRDSVASFLTCDWSKVATISLAIPSFFLEKIKKNIIVKNRIRDSILKNLLLPINSRPDNFQVPLLVIIMLAGQTFLWRTLRVPWR